MASPRLTITNGRETEFEFDVLIQGVSAKEAKVRFVIEGSHYDTTINCVLKETSKKWLAKVPAIPIDETAQRFRVEVIASGYYFCPTQGEIKVQSIPTVKIAEMVQRLEEQPKVEVGITVTAAPTPKAVMMESMSQERLNGLFKRCRSASQIFSRAGKVLESTTTSGNLTSAKLMDVLEAVKKGIDMVEAKLFD